METLPAIIDRNREVYGPGSTDASHSAIGRSTAIDYNLGNMHKNAVLIVDETVAIGPAIRIIESGTEPARG